MTAWKNDELEKIGSAEELQITILRRDGTQRNPVTIWVVRVRDELYVRSYNGLRGSWFRAAQASHKGHIRAECGVSYERCVPLFEITEICLKKVQAL